MSWPIAFVVCFGIFVAAFLFIYVKEYRREEKIMKQYSKSQNASIPLLLVDPMPPAPKKKKQVEAPKVDKKKDMN